MKPFKFFFLVSLGIFVFMFLARFVIMSLVIAAILSLIYFAFKTVFGFVHKLTWYKDDFTREYRHHHKMNLNNPEEGEPLFYEKEKEWAFDFRNIPVK